MYFVCLKMYLPLSGLNNLNFNLWVCVCVHVKVRRHLLETVFPFHPEIILGSSGLHSEHFCLLSYPTSFNHSFLIKGCFYYAFRVITWHLSLHILTVVVTWWRCELFLWTLSEIFLYLGMMIAPATCLWLDLNWLRGLHEFK